VPGSKGRRRAATSRPQGPHMALRPTLLLAPFILRGDPGGGRSSADQPRPAPALAAGCCGGHRPQQAGRGPGAGRGAAQRVRLP
jgi:hypothetical protein